MCFINYMPPDQDDEPLKPGPRPVPQLRWAAPVDIVALGAGLEAFLQQLQQVKALRLCHRFGDRTLSSLPREVLDQIISEMYRVQKLPYLSDWDQKFRCFQGRCNREYHLHPDALTTEYLWHSNYVERRSGVYGDQIEEDGYESWDESVLRDHCEGQDTWLGMVCRCREPTNRSEVNVPFARLASILRTHFGLDVVILHEALPKKLVKFLPDNFGGSIVNYSTACFLALAPPTQAVSSRQDRATPSEEGLFLPEGNHLAYYKSIDIFALHITEGQKQRFTRTMRELDLKPHFHLSKLEELIKPTNNDKALWDICDRQIAECPKPNKGRRRDKRRLLRKYLDKKGEDVAKQDWPQLMSMVDSGVVSPLPPQHFY
ncbi:hypothetical protein BKA63DRAFT_490637 [Paraphoma chrysanthemicola]|nr:hypothetical protein BKA63DRAFT_490637 [Paraphoma chrysanthemicola]